MWLSNIGNARLAVSNLLLSATSGSQQRFDGAALEQAEGALFGVGEFQIGIDAEQVKDRGGKIRRRERLAGR